MLVQSGYPVDYIFRVCVQSINGIQNDWDTPIEPHAADPEFSELIRLLRRVQRKDAIVIHSRMNQKKMRIILQFREPMEKDVAEDLERIDRILGMDRQSKEFRIVYGAFPAKKNEVAMLSRTMLQVMTEFAAYIDVPDFEVDGGSVYASAKNRQVPAQNGLPPLIRVHSGYERPNHAFVTVRYRDRWFWVDDRDLHSKAAFRFLMLLASFTEKGENENLAPVITVPTN